MERHILAKVRSYAQVIKIESNNGRRREHTQCSLKGCCIVFPHDSPSVCSELLTKESMVRNFCIHFVGPQGQYDQLYKETYQLRPDHIFGKAHILYQWYSVLLLVNPHYANEPPPPPLEELSAMLDLAGTQLMGEAIKTFDDDAAMDCDIARDDISEI